MAGDPPAVAGMSIAQIETPALIIDTNVLQANIARLAGIVEAHGADVRLRPHVKAHKSVEIARLQIAAGAPGVCCQTVGEVEAMVAGGIADVQLANEIYGAPKAARLARLAKAARISVCVDDPSQVDDLSNAAQAHGVALDILVEIDVGAARCGVRPGEEAVALVRYVTNKPGLRFAGIQAYHGAAQHLRTGGERAEAIAKAASHARATVLALKEAGFYCETITGGGTGTFENELASGVYTELQCGSYAFMDADYAKNNDGVSFGNALFVLASVISAPVPGRAVCDAGLKALSVDSGLPVVHGVPGAVYQTASDEHGTLQTGSQELGIGDKVFLIPGHCDPTVNMHDWLVPVRNGVVLDTWKVARGR